MTVLYISKNEWHTDELGRFITVLTQEVHSKINMNEEDIFLGVLRELDDEHDNEVIEYHDDSWENLDVHGWAVNKAIEAVNKVAKRTILAPVTKIHEAGTYRIEIEH